MVDITTAATAVRSTRSLVWGLAVSQTVGWGVLFYTLPVLLVPMRDELGWSRSTILGAYAVAILISGLLAPAVGRHLDRDRPRLMMTAGSIAGTLLVVAWSQVHHPVALYLVWIGIGIAHAGVLYDAALPVVIKRSAPDHTKALLTVTLTAGLASFVFQPLASQLTDAYGWRTALVVLALIHAAVTIPVHWGVLPPGPQPKIARTAETERAPELRERSFWVLTAAFAAVTMAAFATMVLLVSYLDDSGWALSTASFAGGTVGLMQLPGRVLFSRVVGSVPNQVLAPVLFAVPAVGVLLLFASGGNPLVWPAVCLLGIGQGALVLLRSTIYVDLYGTERIGALNGASALPLTTVRAIAPFAASLLVAVTAGYNVTFTILAALSMTGAIIARHVLR